MKKKAEWSTGWPVEAGYFWLYSYRYGRISCGRECKPELVFMECRKISNGFIYVGNGQFLDEEEIENPHFQKVILPEPPQLM